MSKLNIGSAFSNDTLLANSISFGVNIIPVIILTIPDMINDIDLFG